MHLSRICLLSIFLTWISTTPVAYGLSFEEISQLAKQPPQSNVEGFLKALKSRHPALSKELSTHFTLMKSSGSPQDATCENPRVITFSKDAGVVMTFNSGHGNYGAGAESTNHVEMMLFDKTSKKFQLVDVDFDKSPPEVSKNNSNCMSCHSDKVSGGANPLPIWNQFPMWHNAYGAFLDRLSPEELKSLNQFKEKAKKDPRYSFLNFESKNPRFPFDRSPEDEPNGNAGLTQQLNDQYSDFLHGLVKENYSSKKELELNLKRALVIEDVCKPMLESSRSPMESQKGSQEKGEEIKKTDAELAQVFAQTDSYLPELLSKMNPPLSLDEKNQIVKNKISTKRQLFRALTGLSLKGRGLATLRKASTKAPEGESCFTSAPAPQSAENSQNGNLGKGVDQEEGLNPRFLIGLPDEVLGNKTRTNSISDADCMTIGKDLRESMSKPTGGMTSDATLHQ